MIAFFRTACSILSGLYHRRLGCCPCPGPFLLPGAVPLARAENGAEQTNWNIGGPPTVYAGDAPETALAEVPRRAFPPKDPMPLNLNTLLLETGRGRVLLEAGAGPTIGPDGGRHFRHLDAMGLTTETSTSPLSSTLARPCRQPARSGRLPCLPARHSDGATAGLSYMPVLQDFRDRFGANIKASVEPYTQDVEICRAGADPFPQMDAPPEWPRSSSTPAITGCC